MKKGKAGRKNKNSPINAKKAIIGAIWIKLIVGVKLKIPCKILICKGL
jgi:hypothetical protein